jgi:hypothetical protein
VQWCCLVRPSRTLVRNQRTIIVTDEFEDRVLRTEAMANPIGVDKKLEEIVGHAGADQVVHHEATQVIATAFALCCIEAAIVAFAKGFDHSCMVGTGIAPKAPDEIPLDVVQ